MSVATIVKSDPKPEFIIRANKGEIADVPAFHWTNVRHFINLLLNNRCMSSLFLIFLC